MGDTVCVRVYVEQRAGGVDNEIVRGPYPGGHPFVRPVRRAHDGTTTRTIARLRSVSACARLGAYMTEDLMRTMMYICRISLAHTISELTLGRRRRHNIYYAVREE